MACLEDGVIARYARGESPPAEVALVQAHLPECPGCEVRLAQIQELAWTSQRTEQDGGADKLETLTSTVLQPAPALERGATMGRYLVVERLGEGGMGVVYAAYDPELNRKVAIKLLRAARATGSGADERQARLVREAQAMARIQHPNVISVHDVGSLGDRVFVAMEFVEGQTLRSWVKERPRPWREVVAAFLDAGKGLAAAHEAGLVHRDFKPENVLIGRDGRVRVMDFGLARLDSSPAAVTVPNLPALRRGATPTGPEAAPALTLDGEVMGTPQYMAPEQRLGLVADARSDQFSFCAALYWAVYRAQPFDPMQLAAAAIDAAEASTASGPRPLNIERSVIKEPPKEPSVPAWLKRAIMRGLALSPEERFGSMQALLAELGRDPWVGQRRWLAVAAGLVVALGAAGLVSQQVTRRAQLCSGAEAQLSGVWDAPIQQAIEAAFLATGKPYAGRSFAGLKQRLDGYSTDWAAMHRTACEDTRVRGAQTEQLLSLRMVCLDQRLKQVRALTHLLSAADAQVMEKSVDAARALPSIQRCADVEALSALVSPPEDAAAREKLELIRSRLAAARALGDAGKYQDALKLAEEAAATADEVRYQPLQADALQQLGWLQMKTGNAPGGESNLAEAVWTAELGRSDETKALAAIKLVYLVGYLQGRAADAQPWIRLARAALGRIGGNDELQLELLSSLASVRLREGKLAEAQALYEQAAALATRALGASDPKRAMVLTALGINYVQQGEHDKAGRVLLEALELLEKVNGPEHPSTAYVHNALSDVFQMRGDYANALLHVRKARAIWEASLGPRHPLVGNAHASVASILFRQGNYAEALVEYQRALEVQLAVLGPEHLDLSYTYEGLGQTYVKLEQARQAVPYLEHALRLRKDDSSAATRFALAQALWVDKQARARARALALQARDVFRAERDDERVRDVDTWLARAR